MRMWHSNIAEDLAPLTIIPRGFGGSNMNDVLHYIDRVVLPYAPRAILLYEGDNDSWAKIPNESIIACYREITDRVFEKLPECRIYFIAVKPSTLRLKILPIVQDLNDEFEQICAGDERMTFLDVETPLLGKNGKPLRDIFLKDNLHMNRKGYLLWRDAIRPVLLEKELEYETSVLLHEDFDGDTSSGLGAMLLDHPLIERADGTGLDGTDGIRVAYKGYEKGSKRVVVRYPLARKVEKATLQFDVRFEEDWQWVHGGKLHGLGPERPITGGNERLPHGWSTRMMFKEDGKIATYLYDQDVEKKWGAGQYTETPVFLAGQWHRVEMETRLNHAGEPNGYTRIRIDGEEVLLSTGYIFRGIDGPETLISQFLFSTFHGGNTPWWTPVDSDGNPTTVYAQFDNILVTSE